jgi:hypothetical protein
MAPNVFKILSKDLFGNPYGDRSYISDSRFELLFDDGRHVCSSLSLDLHS